MIEKRKYEVSEKEIEVANLFSRLGYFTRCHIQIFPIEFKTQASDIDVFATRFDSHLSPEMDLIEVKEGYGKVTELFQLLGFKTYFHPSQAYLVAKDVMETTLQISKKLGVQAATFDRLREIVERDLKLAEERKRISVDLTYADIERVIDYLSIIKRSQDELFWRYHYLWLEVDPYEKFYHLQSLFARSLDLENRTKNEQLSKALEWYKQELFCLSLFGAILIAYDCIGLNQDQVLRFIEDRFYNVGTSKEGKQKVKKGIETLVEQIDKLSKGMIKVAPVEVIPSYVKDLAILVKFLIKNAPFVQSYLLVDDNVQKTNLKGGSKSFKEFTTLEIQAKRVEEMNGILLKILYEGKPISITFNDFI